MFTSIWCWCPVPEILTLRGWKQEDQRSSRLYLFNKRSYNIQYHSDIHTINALNNYYNRHSQLLAGAESPYIGAFTVSQLLLWGKSLSYFWSL